MNSVAFFLTGFEFGTGIANAPIQDKGANEALITMGTRGPQKTPKHILEMRGSWRANCRPDDPDPTTEPVPCKRIKPPAYLGKEARRAFKLQEQGLRESGRLRPEMGPLLATWTLCWLNYNKAQVAVQALGAATCYRLPNGTRCAAPELRILDDCFKRLMKISERLGIFPEPVSVQKSEPTEDMPADEKSKNRFFGGKFRA